MPGLLSNRAVAPPESVLRATKGRYTYRVEWYSVNSAGVRKREGSGEDTLHVFEVSKDEGRSVQRILHTGFSQASGEEKTGIEIVWRRSAAHLVQTVHYSKGLDRRFGSGTPCMADRAFPYFLIRAETDTRWTGELSCPKANQTRYYSGRFDGVEDRNALGSRRSTVRSTSAFGIVQGLSGPDDPRNWYAYTYWVDVSLGLIPVAWRQRLLIQGFGEHVYEAELIRIPRP